MYASRPHHKDKGKRQTNVPRFQSNRLVMGSRLVLLLSVLLLQKHPGPRTVTEPFLNQKLQWHWQITNWFYNKESYTKLYSVQLPIVYNQLKLKLQSLLITVTWCIAMECWYTAVYGIRYIWYRPHFQIQIRCCWVNDSRTQGSRLSIDGQSDSQTNTLLSRHSLQNRRCEMCPSQGSSPTHLASCVGMLAARSHDKLCTMLLHKSWLLLSNSRPTHTHMACDGLIRSDDQWHCKYQSSVTSVISNLI